MTLILNKWQLTRWFPEVEEPESGWLLTERQRVVAATHAPFGITESEAVARAELRHVAEKLMKCNKAPLSGHSRHEILLVYSDDFHEFLKKAGLWTD